MIRRVKSTSQKKVMRLLKKKSNLRVEIIVLFANKLSLRLMQNVANIVKDVYISNVYKLTQKI